MRLERILREQRKYFKKEKNKNRALNSSNFVNVMSNFQFAINKILFFLSLNLFKSIREPFLSSLVIHFFFLCILSLFFINNNSPSVGNDLLMVFSVASSSFVLKRNRSRESGRTPGGLLRHFGPRGWVSTISSLDFFRRKRP